jgi:hypothetical protein
MGLAAKTIDLDQARLDPGSVFDHPHDVLAVESLSKADKKSILSRWEQDADALLRASDEGMQAEGRRSPAELLRAIQHAIQELDDAKGCCCS